MYFSDSWSFLLELEEPVVGSRGMVPAMPGGLVPVDLSEEDDWGDIEPYRDAASGFLGCRIGKHDKEGDEVREVVRVWEYREDRPFNGKFAFFEPVPLPQFVGRLLDAGVNFGQTEDEITELKEDRDEAD